MSRYLRLMALAGIELLSTTPLSVFLMALNLTAQPLEPWVSWGETHFNFSRVELVPAVIWSLNRWLVVGIQVNRWSGPFCAFVFFAFFGFAAEARKNYRNAVSKVLAACRLKRDLSLQKVSPRSATLSHFTPTYSFFFQSSEAYPCIFVHGVFRASCIHTSSTTLSTLRYCDNPFLTRRERVCASCICGSGFRIHYICLRKAPRARIPNTPNARWIIIVTSFVNIRC